MFGYSLESGSAGGEVTVWTDSDTPTAVVPILYDDGWRPVGARGTGWRSFHECAARVFAGVAGLAVDNWRDVETEWRVGG